MDIGFIGLGRMGGNMVRRLTKGGHKCHVFSIDQAEREALAAETGSIAAGSLADLVSGMPAPRTVWMMVPAGKATQGVIDEIRISRTARYADGFKPQRRFDVDEATLALYHCDERGSILRDATLRRCDGKVVSARFVAPAQLAHCPAAGFRDQPAAHGRGHVGADPPECVGLRDEPMQLFGRSRTQRILKHGRAQLETRAQP